MSAAGIERTKRTRFRKGHDPHNTLFDGAVTIRNDDGRMYLFIRKAEGKWELLSRVVWRELYGDIPPGYNVQFKDGNSLNCEPDNLYIISKSNQAVVNKKGGNALPFELRQAIELTHQLKQKIDEKQDN